MGQLRCCRRVVNTFTSVSTFNTICGYTDSNNIKILCSRLVVADALRRAIPSLDIVLTPNGFGVVSTQNLAPASKPRVDLIFRTNIQTAYNVGHYEQMTDPGVMKLRPFWQYDAVNDTHTRPSHLAMDGKVFPADHPVWNTWFPPNGFRCRCTVRTLSKRQVEAREIGRAHV